jgi:hypothetical protein
MSEQTGSRVRKWLLQQARPQADGTYLVRPFRWFPPLVYQVDAPTRDRLITVQLWYGRAALAVLLFTLLFANDSRSWTFWAIVVGIVAVGYGAPLLVLRHARRLPRSRWSGPAVVLPETRYSRGVYLALFALSIATMLFLIYAVRRTLQQPGAEFSWTLGFAILLLALCAARFWTLYRRGKAKPD